jgi:hypothetical protein
MIDPLWLWLGLLLLAFFAAGVFVGAAGVIAWQQG